MSSTVDPSGSATESVAIPATSFSSPKQDANWEHARSLRAVSLKTKPAVVFNDTYVGTAGPKARAELFRLTGN